MRTMHSTIRWTLSAGALLGSLACTGLAHASPEFPGELADQLGMDCPPPCTICHRDQNGGLGTVDKDFGTAMYDAGLRPKKTETIAPALAALEAGGGGSAGSGGSGGAGGSGGTGGSGGSGGSGGVGGADGGGDDGGTTEGGTTEGGATGGTGGTGGSGATGGSGGSGGTTGGAVDSDQDGVGDVEELRNNSDPNVPGGSIKCGPTYGCGARVEPHGRVDGIALAGAIAVALGLFAFGRRRR